MTLRISTGAKNKQLGFSTNLVTNGTFSTDASGWTAVTATLTGGVDSIFSRDNVLRVDTAGGYGHQVITTEVGRKYMLSLAHTNGGTGTGQVKVGTAAGGSQLYDSGALSQTAAWYNMFVVFTATTTTTYISLYCSDANPQYYDSVEMYDISSSFKEMFNLSFLKIYTGTQPASADDAPTGSLLVTISNASSGTVGVTWDDATAGTISKKTGETWSGVCVASGTAGWGRIVTGTDTGASSTTEERLDFAVGTVGAQANFSSVAFTSGATQTISTCVLTLPSA